MVQRPAWLVCLLMAMCAVGCVRTKSEVQGSAPTQSESTLALAPTEKPPRAEVDRHTYSFEPMDQNSLGTHRFEVRNEGEGELRLRIQNTSCGCTSVKVGDVVWNPKEFAPKRIITVPPGDMVDVEMNWDTEQRSGEFRTTAKVETNDPKQPVLSFIVQGTIIPFVEITQPQLRIEQASNSDGTISSTHVFSKKFDDLEILSVVSSNPLVTVEFEPAETTILETLNAKSGKKANIKILPGLPIGPFNASLVFRTNHEERPEVTMSVVGLVQGDVLLSPESNLNFGIVTATVGSSKVIFIKVRSEDKAEIKVSHVDPEFVKATIQEFESGKNRWQLKVEVPIGAPGGQFKGMVELETTHPTAKVVKIPVRFQVSR